MLDYESAFERAKELKKDIDLCTEYEKGYVFSCSDDDNYVGGSHTPVTILKEDGRAIPFNAFVAQGTGKEIRAFNID